MTQDRRTSELERELAKEGWRWVTNVDPKVDYDAARKHSSYGMPLPFPRSREAIRKEYQGRFSTKVVRVEDAFDSNGRPTKDMVAVYVKEVTPAEQA